MKKTLTVAVNTRFLLKEKLEGIGFFTYETLQRIVLEHPEITFYFLFDRRYSEDFIFASNVTPVVLFPPARHPLLWFWWFEISVSGWLKKNTPDLFLSPDSFACLGSNVPQVIVMHDLSFEHYPEYVTFPAKLYYKFFMPRYAKKARRIATVSEFSKKDITKIYGIEPEKIDVVYSGVKSNFSPVNDEVKKRIRTEYSQGTEFFLYIGSIHPRKNLGRMLRAFDMFKDKTISPVKLLVIGRKAWDFSEVEEIYATMNHKNDVNFMGYVSTDIIPAIAASASAILFVSLFEGFGIPILEGMQCGVPIITSTTSSMPEIAGNAAMLIDPFSTEDIAIAMDKLMKDDLFRKLLIEAGFNQAKTFSWHDTADRLWKSCETALQTQNTI